MKLEEKILKLRKEQGLSQEEFGEKITVSRQAVSKWENGETKPDIDKLKLIAETFNVSYEYLLNDALDEMETGKIEEFAPKEKIWKKIKKSFIFKIIIILFSVYMIFSLYKFIVVLRMYLIANSFSEENYTMNSSMNSYELGVKAPEIYVFNSRKDNEMISKHYVYDENYETKYKDQKGNDLPYFIEYINLETNEKVRLILNMDNGKYSVENLTEEEVKSFSGNIIKELATSYFDVNFILEYTFNPFCYYISPITRTILMYSPSNLATSKIEFDNVGLVRQVSTTIKDRGYIEINYSYDYVQGHFDYIEIENPLEIYKDLIE